MDSKSVDDLEDLFKTKVNEFIKALEAAGANVDVVNTLRSEKRAYLFHWSWLIGLDKAKASEATERADVEIQWDHGDEEQSKKGAKEMIDGFGLAVPPNSTNAPALDSRHIEGKAIDMNITWTDTIKVKNKDGTETSVKFDANVNANTTLHGVGATYGVIKLKRQPILWWSKKLNKS